MKLQERELALKGQKITADVLNGRLYPVYCCASLLLLIASLAVLLPLLNVPSAAAVYVLVILQALPYMILPALLLVFRKKQTSGMARFLSVFLKILFFQGIALLAFTVFGLLFIYGARFALSLTRGTAVDPPSQIGPDFLFQVLYVACGTLLYGKLTAVFRDIALFFEKSIPGRNSAKKAVLPAFILIICCAAQTVATVFVSGGIAWLPSLGSALNAVLLWYILRGYADALDKSVFGTGPRDNAAAS